MNLNWNLNWIERNSISACTWTSEQMHYIDIWQLYVISVLLEPNSVSSDCSGDRLSIKFTGMTTVLSSVEYQMDPVSKLCSPSRWSVITIVVQPTRNKESELRGHHPIRESDMDKSVAQDSTAEVIFSSRFRGACAFQQLVVSFQLILWGLVGGRLGAVKVS